MKSTITIAKVSVSIILLVLLGCQSESADDSDSDNIEIVDLEDHQTIISNENEDVLLMTPAVIKHGNNSNLFIYDSGQGHVLEVNEQGDQIHEYGRSGSGPGEFHAVNNLFLVDTHLFAVDFFQYYIHKFENGGEVISTMDFGALSGISPSPPPMMMSRAISMPDINNQPFITQNGQVLISSTYLSQRSQNNSTVESVFEMVDWEGNHISDIGEIPDSSAFFINPNSTFLINSDDYWSAIENREVPAVYKPNAFPVSDPSNRNELFVVYSAIPKIEKYSMQGEKLWESEIPYTAEMDTVARRYYEKMDQFEERTSIATLKKYVSGVGGPDGDLYVALVSNPDGPLWIHHFDTDGELVRRYRFISDVELHPIFDIDFTGNRLFVVTDEAEIRAYSL